MQVDLFAFAGELPTTRNHACRVTNCLQQQDQASEKIISNNIFWIECVFDNMPSRYLRVSTMSINVLYFWTMKG